MPAKGQIPYGAVEDSIVNELVRLPPQDKSLSYGNKFWRGLLVRLLLPHAEPGPRFGWRGNDEYINRTYSARWSAVTWWRWVMFVY